MSDAAPALLRHLALRMRRAPGGLRPQIHAALAAHGEPLRWAITAVQGDELCIEAVVLVPPSAAEPSPER